MTDQNHGESFKRAHAIIVSLLCALSCSARLRTPNGHADNARSTRPLSEKHPLPGATSNADTSTSNATSNAHTLSNARARFHADSCKVKTRRANHVKAAQFLRTASTRTCWCEHQNCRARHPANCLHLPVFRAPCQPSPSGLLSLFPRPSALQAWAIDMRTCQNFWEPGHGAVRVATVLVAAALSLSLASQASTRNAPSPAAWRVFHPPSAGHCSSNPCHPYPNTCWQSVSWMLLRRRVMLQWPVRVYRFPSLALRQRGRLLLYRVFRVVAS